MRATIKNAISKIRNQKKEHENTRFIVSDVLDSLNNEKYGSEDTYTKTEINNLIAGTISGEFVPLAGTTSAKPITGGLFGQPRIFNQFKIRNFLLGKTVSNDDNSYGLVINNDSLDGVGTGYKTKLDVSNGISSFDSKYYLNNVLNSSVNQNLSKDRIDNTLVSSTYGTNKTTLQENNFNVSLYSGSGNSLQYTFDDTGVRITKYITPNTDFHFVQKKYVDDAVAGATPTGFIPLTGANNITGALVATQYFTPSSANAWVQKQYVDTTIGNANFIPMAGATTITGQLASNTYFPPISANAWVQKKYVDDAISGIPQPTGFIPLAGASNITGALSGTTYIVPANNNTYVQKKYVDDAVAGNVPTGFIPLAGANNITGALAGTSYIAPSGNTTYVQKQYVDNAISAVPTNFIPLAGATNITGLLTGNAYFAPTGNFSFVQKQYVDTAISGIPTNFIPLAGTASLTGQIIGNSYFNPTNANALVQKKYVDDKFTTSLNFVPMTGTVDGTPMTGMVEMIKDTSNYFRFGEPNPVSGTTGSGYGFQIGATADSNNLVNILSVDDSGFAYYSVHNVNGESSSIKSVSSSGATMSSENFRGSSQVIVFSDSVRIGAKQAGASGFTEIFVRYNMLTASEVFPWANLEEESFIQKGVFTELNSLDINPRSTGGLFNKQGTADSEVFQIVIEFATLIGSPAPTIDLTPYGMREIVDISGKVRDVSNKMDFMINSFHPLTFTAYANLDGSLRPESITIQPVSDMVTSKGWLYIKYTR